jgi:hypothetical protein
VRGVFTDVRESQFTWDMVRARAVSRVGGDPPIEAGGMSLRDE